MGAAFNRFTDQVTPRRLAAALALAGLIALDANAGPITVVNGDFEAVAVTTALGYAYQSDPPATDSVPNQDLNNTPGIGWTFAKGAGLTQAATNFNPPPFGTENGTNVAFIQGGTGSTISQSFTGFADGDAFTLSFLLGSRFGGNSCCTGNQTIEVLFDGSVIASFALTDSTPFAARSVSGIASGTGPHTLLFRGASTSGDQTAFIDNVSITTAVPAPAAPGLVLLGLAVVLTGQSRARARALAP